jgi:hypothetical protein
VAPGGGGEGADEKELRRTHDPSTLHAPSGHGYSPGMQYSCGQGRAVQGMYVAAVEDSVVQQQR